MLELRRRWVVSAAVILLLGCSGVTPADNVEPETVGPLDAKEELVEDVHVLFPEVDADPTVPDRMVWPDVSDDAMEPDISVDLGGTPGSAGWPCATGDECDSGFCVQTPAGKQCTVTCFEECPFDWVCLLHKPSLPDDVYICLPVQLNLCKPCDKNSDCETNGAETGDACVSYGEGGNFCGAVCMGAADCPQGYDCKQVLDVWGGEVQQCVLASGECECKEWFMDEEAFTTCSVTNEWGTCEGVRVCTAQGLGSCDAAEPTKEKCNGEDDDCDGEVDEDAAGETCFVENEYGACKGTYDCSGGQLLCDADIAEPELCDGLDNDCDGQTDEGFADSDKDGVADCLEADKDGDGVVDIEDNCPYAANPAQEDFDFDGMGDACDADDDNDMSADVDDCEPLDPEVNPNSEEVCNGKDDDCDGLIDEGFVDIDTDGFANCIDDDDDGDGFVDAADCAPENPDIFPGAQELCDGVDNDCDWDVDESFPDTDLDGDADCIDPDMDADGVPNDLDNCPGTSNLGQEDLDEDGTGDACDPDYDGDGVPNGTDTCPGLFNPSQKDLDDDGVGDLCDADQDGDDILDEDDNCALVPNPEQLDQDEDGAGDACDDDADGDGDPDASDCAPYNPYVFAGADEECDGLDNDCDFQVDEAFPDDDGDGVKNCVDPDDDGDGDPDLSDCAPSDPATHAGASEICNGLDDNCSGEADEDLGLLACGKGACFHTVAACAGGEGQTCDPMEGAAFEECDSVDNDCDGLVDEDLGWTTCGKGVCFHSVDLCEDGQPQVCDPMEGAELEQCDGQDNDCDGGIDEELGTLSCGLGICEHTVVACANGVPVICDEMEGSQPEVCDGLDNDCDGKVDEGYPDFDDDGLVDCLDPDDDGDGDPDFSDCAPMNPDLHHAADEICDGVDNNCAGGVDEENAGGCEVYYEDVDWDGHGGPGSKCLCVPTPLYKAAAADDCNDSNPWIFPGASELCDGVDNNCDEETDEDGATGCNWYFPDPDGDGYGSGEPSCTCDAPGGPWSVLGGDCDEESSEIHPGTVELCDEKDNDCDDEIDEGIDLLTDPANCGACGQLCQPNNAFGKCQGGDCKVGDCISGFMDCNEIPADGCEINTDQDEENCGGCDTVCVLTHAAPTCLNGQCAVGGCDEHYADDDGIPENGCEDLLYGKQADDPGLSCHDIKTFDGTVTNGNYYLDPNGGAPEDAFLTYCNMSSSKNAPDYKLVTPDQFYHADNSTKHGAPNGVDKFNYSCDACGAAQQWYNYPCPDQHWEVVTYDIRSHCNHGNHKSDQVFTSETYTSGGIPGIRYRQKSDDCGDPNEFTIIGVCRVKGVGIGDPGGWNSNFMNVSWSN